MPARGRRRAGPPRGPPRAAVEFLYLYDSRYLGRLYGASRVVSLSVYTRTEQLCIESRYLGYPHDRPKINRDFVKIYI